MHTWLNWVDLILVTFFVRACYVGYARGLTAAFIHLVGASTILLVTLRYWEGASRLLVGVLPFSPGVVEVLSFWVFFLLVLLTVRLTLNAVLKSLKWERVHWVVQGIGLVLGGIRGLAWAAFILVVLASTGIRYVTDSTTVHSMFGKRFIRDAHTALRWALAQVPPQGSQPARLVPPLVSTPQ